MPTNKSEKPLATVDAAKALGIWAARERVDTIVVFGVDVVFARRAEHQMMIPRRYNDVMWSGNLLEIVGSSFKAARNEVAPAELKIEYEGGIKPGDPGFELPHSNTEQLELAL